MSEKYGQEEIDLMIQQHQLWLKDKSQGKRFSVCYEVLAGVTIENVDLSYADFEGTLFRDVVFYNVKLKEANMGYSTISGRFIGCDFQLTNLLAACLEDVKFECCSFVETNFTNVQFNGAVIEGSLLINSYLDFVNMVNLKTIGCSYIDCSFIHPQVHNHESCNDNYILKDGDKIKIHKSNRFSLISKIVGLLKGGMYHG